MYTETETPRWIENLQNTILIGALDRIKIKLKRHKIIFDVFRSVSIANRFALIKSNADCKNFSNVNRMPVTAKPCLCGINNY